MEKIDVNSIPIEILLGKPSEFIQDYFIKPDEPIKLIDSPVLDFEEEEDTPIEEIEIKEDTNQVYHKKSVNDIDAVVSDIMSDDTYGKLMEISDYHGALDDEILNVEQEDSGILSQEEIESLSVLKSVVDVDPNLTKDEMFNYSDLVGLRATEAMKILNIKHRSTLEGLVNRGAVKKVYTGEKTVRFSTLDIHRIARGYKRSKIIAIYVRVWEKKKKLKRALIQQQVKRLLEYTTKKNIPVKRIYRDYGFSLDFSKDHRKGFHTLLYDVIRNRVDIVIIESPDRLSGIAYELIVQLFSYFGTKIVFLNSSPVNNKYRNEMIGEISQMQKIFSRAIRSNKIVDRDVDLYNTEYSKLLNIS